MYGLHAPVRLEMERQLVAAAPTPLSLGLPGSGFTRPGNLGLDILTGRDEEIRPEDVLIGAYPTLLPEPHHRLTQVFLSLFFVYHCDSLPTLDALDSRAAPLSPPDRVHTAPPADFHRTMERKLRIA